MAKRATALASAAVSAATAVCAQAQDRSLIIAATTSIEDSGLFAHILPQFSARTGIAVRVVSRRRHPFMSNRFVIVGPQADPAGVRGMTDASKALREIARQRATFVSRGDNSGTYAAEQRLWQAARVNPKARSGYWYRETGLGMRLTVQMAIRLNAYTLTDRATWLRAGPHAASQILVDDDPQLFNPYEIILVDPASHPHVDVAAANAFIDWLLSEESKAAIRNHRVDGEHLFAPAPGPMN